MTECTAATPRGAGADVDGVDAALIIMMMALQTGAAWQGCTVAAWR
jgi:hypothetical protein